MAAHTYEFGGDTEATLVVEIADSFGEQKVVMKARVLGLISLTAEKARALAADLMAKAEELEKPQ